MIMAEDEWKALALYRLSEAQPLLSIGLPGAWGWQGVVDESAGPHGEQHVVKGPIADLDRVCWQGRLTYLAFEVNARMIRAAQKALAEELAKRGAEVRIVDLPEVAEVSGIDELLAAWGPARVLELISEARPFRDARQPYEETPHGIIWLKPTREGIVRVPVINFLVHIVEDIELDDGVEPVRFFDIEAEVDGRSRRVRIPAAEFSQMNWVTECFGASAVIYPGMSQHAKTAIQLLSRGAQRRQVFTHTGWREYDGRWIFLHGGGAIGADGPVPGVAVKLSPGLERFKLPLPTGPELLNAIRADLKLLEIAPAEITYPLFSQIYRTALGRSNSSVHITGPTGAGKTELAALAQQHFGAEMDARHLPCSWNSTPNAIERIAFEAKDCLLVVDDFVPRGGSADIQRMHGEADRLLRAQGNQAGRMRMRPDSTLQDYRPSRATLLSTRRRDPLRAEFASAAGDYSTREGQAGDHWLW